MMIHDPWGVAVGNAEELRKNAALLDQMKEVCMSFYRGKFKNCTAEQLSALMSAETWYTGNECKENGLECTVIASDVRAAAAVCAKSFEKIPEAAAKYLAKKDLTDEGRAELDAARKAALEANAKIEAPAPSEPASAPSASVDWEARYKGQSKKLNELNARIADLEQSAKSAADEASAKIAELTAAVAAKDQAIKDFNDQVEQTGFKDLAALTSAVSTLKAELETSAKDLADTREQLEHMKETRDLLTGSVLTPQNKVKSFSTFAEAVDALGYVEAAKKYPELKASYRVKKNK